MAWSSRHKVALGAALLAVGGGLWAVWSPTSDVPSAVAPSAQIKASQAATGVAMPERLLDANRQLDVMQRIRARQVGGRPLFADEQAFQLARQQQVLFAEGGLMPHDAEQSPLASERRLQDGRHWIRYDMRVLAARAEGDRFLLPLMGSAVEAEIESVYIIDGQHRWSGRLLGPEGGTFHITHAVSDDYAVGAINTPHGEYLLESKGGKGWVAESHKEFFLPPDGNDTRTDEGVRPAPSAHKH